MNLLFQQTELFELFKIRTHFVRKYITETVNVHKDLFIM